MSGKSIFANIVSFVGKYAGEARSTATALSMILDNLAIQPQDRAQIKAHIDAILNGVDNIADWIENASEPAAVKISRDDVNDAVAAVIKDSDALHTLIDNAVAARIDAAVAAYGDDHIGNGEPPASLVAFVNEAIDKRLADGTAFHASLIDADNGTRMNEANPAKDLSNLASGDKVKEASSVKTKDLVNANTGNKAK